MGDTYAPKIKQTSQQLVGVSFKPYPRHGGFLPILLDGLVQILLVEVHHHIQVLLAALVCEEGVLHVQNIWVVEHFEDL